MAKKLFRGLSSDYYRIYKDEKGIYYRYTGKKLDFKFKAKNKQRPIGMMVGHKPYKNFKVIK